MPEASGDVTQLLVEGARAFPVDILSKSRTGLNVAVHIQRPGGSVVDYGLRIEAPGEEPRVKEEPRQHLPTCCPNRHINHGGYFCLGYSAEDALAVRTLEDADRKSVV